MCCLFLPNYPDDEANDWDEEGEKGEGKTQEKTQGPAITIWVAHILCVFSFFFVWEEEEVGESPWCVIKKARETRLVA